MKHCVKRIFYNILRKIDECSKSSFDLFDLTIVFESRELALSFRNYIKLERNNCSFFYPNIISINDTEILHSKIERIVVLIPMLKHIFHDLKYSNIFEYAGDLSDFIRDYYAYNLSNILNEIECTKSELKYLINLIFAYEKFLDVLSKRDGEKSYREYLDNLFYNSRKIFHVSSCDNNSIPIYNDIFNSYSDKIDKININLPGSEIDISKNIFYAEFPDMLDKAEFAACYIYKKLLKQESVLMVSNNRELNDLVCVFLKKFGVNYSDYAGSFKKTDLYNLIVNSVEVLEYQSPLVLLDFLKNIYIDADPELLLLLEKQIYSFDASELNLSDFVQKCLDNVSVSEVSDNISNKSITEFVENIRTYVTSKDFFKNDMLFDDFVKIHADITKNIIPEKYKIVVEDFFDFVIRITKGIFSEKIDLYEYIRLIKKIGSFYNVPSKNLYNYEFNIVDPINAKFLFADYVIFADIDDDTFPCIDKQNYWVRESILKKLGIVKKFSIDDFYSIISSSGKDCLILHSDILKKKRSHFIDVLFNDYGEVIKQYDLSDYYNDKHVRKQNIKRDFTKQILRPILPSPSPDIKLRPKNFSVTDIGYLIKNPYKIYVKYILDLKEINLCNSGDEYISRGVIIHNTIQEIFQKGERYKTQKDVKVNRLWGYNLYDLMDYYISEVKNFSDDYLSSYMEISANLRIGDFFIKSRADRVDLFDNGEISIIDYKTGTLPSKSSVLGMINPQVVIEGIIFKFGSSSISVRGIRNLQLVKLSRDVDKINIVPKDKSIDEFLNDAMDKLRNVLNDSLKNPYKAYKIIDGNIEIDSVFHLSRANEIFY